MLGDLPALDKKKKRRKKKKKSFEKRARRVHVARVGGAAPAVTCEERGCR